MLAQCHSRRNKTSYYLPTTIVVATTVISNSKIVSTMSYSRFILIGIPVDKCQQIETITDSQRYIAFEI